MLIPNYDANMFTHEHGEHETLFSRPMNTIDKKRCLPIL